MAAALAPREVARRASAYARGLAIVTMEQPSALPWSHCAEYKAEVLATLKAMTQPGKGIFAMDESNSTCGLRLRSIGVENTELNRQRWRETLLGTKGLGDFCGGAILFTETRYQDTTVGMKMVDLAKDNCVIPGIKVDTGLVPLVGGKEGDNWCRGLDDLKERTVDYYKAGACLEAVYLKPSMATPGAQSGKEAEMKTVAELP